MSNKVLSAPLTTYTLEPFSRPSRIVPIFRTGKPNTMIPNGPARNQFARRRRELIC